MGFCARSQVALFVSVFFSCVSFAIVMPSLWPYLHTLSSSKSFLAWVVAFYSVGEAIGAVYFGRMADRLSTRYVMLVATGCGLVGSTLYVLAEAFPKGGLGPWLVFVGRFAQGMWTGGSQAVQTTFLAAVLPIDELTPAIVTLNAYACLGFVIGPVFGLVFDLIPPFPLALGFNVSELTGPGYFVLISAAFILFLFVAVFDEEADRASAPPSEQEARSSEGPGMPLLQNADENKTGEGEVIRTVAAPRLLGIKLGAGLIVCNIIFFVHFYGFALQETITTPLVQAYYNWSVLQANELFTAAGVCALVSFIAVHKLSKRMTDRAMMGWSLSLGALGYVLLVSTPNKPLSQRRFLYGFMAISVAFPVGRATTVSLYTKLLPLKDQGIGQGIILAVGAVARILGPFWAVRAFLLENGALIVFGFTAALFMGSLALMGAFYSKLQV